MTMHKMANRRHVLRMPELIEKANRAILEATGRV